MVHWTQGQKEEITHAWGSIDKIKLISSALERMFKVYPWTFRYFKDRHGFTVQGHAAKVSGALDTAVSHLDDVKSHFKVLSSKHADELYVDAGSFHLLTDCIIIEMAWSKKDKFTPHIHATWDKFFKVVVDAISKQYI
ncbi:hemoglobin subunit beta-like [Carcharodon carcharias]|uniref:hemoglobin subunit beta-like n=1 Tax=Carcharodon carcharias TaxID=13397 RepID=UPI001B7E5E70|nr:hemoglobin subunit beta-like [Carcharodon carcharias]